MREPRPLPPTCREGFPSQPQRRHVREGIKLGRGQEWALSHLLAGPQGREVQSVVSPETQELEEEQPGVRVRLQAALCPLQIPMLKP